MSRLFGLAIGRIVLLWSPLCLVVAGYVLVPQESTGSLSRDSVPAMLAACAGIGCAAALELRGLRRRGAGTLSLGAAAAAALLSACVTAAILYFLALAGGIAPDG